MATVNQAQDILELDRDSRKAEILHKTCWLCSCYCFGVGLSTCCPMVLQQDKCCCILADAKSDAECCGDLGCISGLDKILCGVMMHEFPPSPCMCAVCSCFCCGKPGTQPVKNLTADEFEQMAFMKDVFWVLYCCCAGFGCARCSDPLVKGKTKLMCCLQNCETAAPDQAGCCYMYEKWFCFSTYVQYPPRGDLTPGVGCCGVTCGRSMGDDRAVMVQGRQVEMSRV